MEIKKLFNLKMKIYLISSFLLIFFVWAGMVIFKKNLEEFFLWKILRNQEILPAEILKNFHSLKPLRNWEIKSLEIEATAGMVVEIDRLGREKVLFKKNEKKPLPIASITKLMTALVVLDNYDLSYTFPISENAVLQEGKQGQLQVNEIISVKDLLYIMLIESSNDAAYALSEVLGVNSFVDLMNLKAKVLNLNNTHFVNPTGLDPLNSETPINYSTAEDLVKLTHFLLKKHSSIFQILNLKQFHLYRPNGTYHHLLLNTNELLGEYPEIVGGKTGQTKRAKGTLVLVSKSPRKTGYLIYVILGAKDRFAEARKLINWISKAYIW